MTSKPSLRPEVIPAIPLAGWAEAQLQLLAKQSGAREVSALGGAALLAERAQLNEFLVPGRQSAGGGCRLFSTRDGEIALNLARADDRALLPALFGDAELDGQELDRLASRFAECSSAQLLAQARMLGMAAACVFEQPVSLPVAITASGPRRTSSPAMPLVVDLSALWAGPLTGRLLGLAGAHVVRIESIGRPDVSREEDSEFFERLNGTKEVRTLDLRTGVGRDSLVALIRAADFVIEAARPRALLQLGIDADALVRETPGLVWLAICGHGISGDAANWIGFGDDCGVAGGLSAALLAVTGEAGFVGDAIADPLTGIYAARAGWAQYQRGTAARMIFSMSAITSAALTAEKAHDGAALDRALAAWAEARGTPIFARAPC